MGIAEVRHIGDKLIGEFAKVEKAAAARVSPGTRVDPVDAQRLICPVPMCALPAIPRPAIESVCCDRL